PKELQRRLNLKSPGLKQSLGNILGVLVPPRPLPKSGGPNVLVRAELELLHYLFEGGHCGHYGAYGLRLAPIRISTTLCHRFGVLRRVDLPSLPRDGLGGLQSLQRKLQILILRRFSSKINKKMAVLVLRCGSFIRVDFCISTCI